MLRALKEPKGRQVRKEHRAPQARKEHRAPQVREVWRVLRGPKARPVQLEAARCQISPVTLRIMENYVTASSAVMA